MTISNIRSVKNSNNATCIGVIPAVQPVVYTEQPAVYTEQPAKKPRKITKPRKAKKSVPKRLRTIVWEREFTIYNIGVCYTCGSKIKQDSYHCGHIIAEAKGGLTIASNLMPVCSSCNLSMGTMDMNEFKKLVMN